jgi:2,3-bisphosphoglycerate-dependent phosphoglycerate mutase
MDATARQDRLRREEPNALTPSVILVRHAAPRIIEEASPTRWSLSEKGRTAAAHLGEQLAEISPAGVVSSPEPKAAETAGIIGDCVGLPVILDGGFVEHRRPGLGFVSPEQFEASIRRVFEHPSERPFGGESADEAHARFEEALARHSKRPLIVVTHGTVLSLFVARLCGIEPMRLWASLELPEALILNGDMRMTARLTAG